MTKEKSFTEGPILLPLIQFALPILAALFLQTMYGAVDLLVVGQFADAVDVSAVATGSMLMHSVTVVITGLSMGITILVGQYIGQGKPEKAGKIIGSGIVMFLLIAAALTLVVAVFSSGLAGLLQAPEEAFERTSMYIRICAMGSLFIVAYNVLGSIFRGIGDSTMPLISVMIACVFNVIGDLFFVAVLHLGAAGTAIATVCAQALSVLLSFLIIRKRTLPFTISLRDIRFDTGKISRILQMGIPIALQDLLVSISFLVIMGIVNGLGVIASAGVGVAEKLCGFIMLAPSAYMQSLSAFVAQNVGAEKHERADKTLMYGVSTSLMVGVIMFYAAFFHGDILSGLFAKDTEIIAASAEYLKAYAIDTFLTSFLFCFVGYFNGYGQTLFVMIQGIIGGIGVRIPAAFLISRVDDSLFHIGLATPCSSLVQIILCIGYFMIMKKKRKTRGTKQ